MVVVCVMFGSFPVVEATLPLRASVLPTLMSRLVSIDALPPGVSSLTVMVPFARLLMVVVTVW